VRTDRDALVAQYAFPLDTFQLKALDALDAGESVLVAAPTGSGKTVVAEYAIASALKNGRRTFYTAPIKALSNQKFQDLSRVHGVERVGLLTGDNSINSGAPVVVMTTEVLRNMIYARSDALNDLAYVVLDEVHFIQDTYRGPVWEEVIVHLPRHVRLVCLSATVSNAAEVADWITTVRGPTSVVVEERRPVRLENLYMVGDKTSERLHLLPTLVQGRPNPEAGRLDDEAARGWRGGRSRRGSPTHARRKLYTPARVEVVERLDDEDMLPAVYFIFSRNQCDQAAKTCLDAGLRLTTGEERERIRQIVDRRLDGLGARDLAVLGYATFLSQLEAGIAAHHAGMVPPFKEVVEACFTEGLVKVVFATETLAVGINMPARSVVIEKLTKFQGDHHAFLTPGEYTQLTGRAGRRGIDDSGQAIVLWSPFVPFDQVAGLASSRSFNLHSAFRPTYNMAANLVRSYTSEQAHHLLNLSLAQYQADREVVKIETRLDRRQAHLADLRVAAASPFGDVDEYRRLIEDGSRPPRWRSDEMVEAALSRLRPGDVLHVEKGRYAGKAAVIAAAHRKGGMRITLLTMRRDTLMMSAHDFDEPPKALGKIDLPEPFAPNRQDFQRAVVHSLERARLAPRSRRNGRRATDDALGDGDGRRHAVEEDPDLEDRLRAAAQADRVAREVDDLKRRVKGHNQSLARQFDRVLRILEAWEYVDGWSLTDAGQILARTFHECDLLVVECLREGLLDGLDPSALAGLVSVFTYEHRTSEPPPAPWYPSQLVRKRWNRINRISAELSAEEEDAGLTPHRAPDPTFVAVAYAWAAGEGFAEVVEEEELSGGDFVRNVKQLIDLLRQLAIVAPVPDTRRAADEAAQRLFRGVVAASSTVTAVVDDDEPTDAVPEDERRSATGTTG
jgi:ATP-dependent RNA helicase HelY